jgi:hypothetical protein
MDNCPKCKELEFLLERERDIHLKIAIRADVYYQQLQAIREAAFGELCSITAGEPEDMTGLQELE